MEEIYKIKKIVALLIALVMMISVCACTQNAEPTRQAEISYAVFCLKKKKKK